MQNAEGCGASGRRLLPEYSGCSRKPGPICIGDRQNYPHAASMQNLEHRTPSVCRPATSMNGTQRRGMISMRGSVCVPPLRARCGSRHGSAGAPRRSRPFGAGVQCRKHDLDVHRRHEEGHRQCGQGHIDREGREHQHDQHQSQRMHAARRVSAALSSLSHPSSNLALPAWLALIDSTTHHWSKRSFGTLLCSS